MRQLSEAHCRLLAARLGELLSTVLWPHYEGWVLERAPGIELATRVGSGRATYHRASRQGGHLIVFGWKMIQQKSQGWETAVRWTSGRELALRNYFQGRIELGTLLAHAVCHEFAHLIQTVTGGRRRGSVHNAAFYKVLDEMHANGMAEQVLKGLCATADEAGVDLDWHAQGHSQGQAQASAAAMTPTSLHPAQGQQAVSSPKPSANARFAAELAALSAKGGATAPRRPRLPRQQTDLKPGDSVSFVAKGRRVTGTVRRVNRQTVTVVPDKPARPGQYWRVGPRLLERVE